MHDPNIGLWDVAKKIIVLDCNIQLITTPNKTNEELINLKINTLN